MGFVHLHVHTDYSILDGLGKIKDYVARAKELGMTALAITDHGVGYGLDDFYDECKAGGIKPILGCECYVAPSDRRLREAVDSVSYYHLILLVKNETGYKNLCKLITRSNTEGFYKKPRIDWELLTKFHEGLICTSACVAGEVAQKVLNNDFEGAKKTALRYKELFGEDYYLEIQNHGIHAEEIAFQEIIKIAKTCEIPLVCTNDCHYVRSEDKEAHDWLLCMQTKTTLNDPDRMRYQGDYSLKSEEEMRTLFPALPDAFDNTEKIAEQCSFDFQYTHKPSDYRMPKVVIPKEYGTDYYRYLSDEAWKGLENRYPKGHKEREQAEKRLTYELSVIKSMGFSEYFLDIRRTIMWAKNHNILVGPGRGCQIEGGIVYTKEGAKQIENIRIGDTVFDCTGIPSTVKNTFRYQVSEPLLKISTWLGGNVSFTKDHKFYAVKCRTIGEGKSRRYLDERPEGLPQWIRANQLVVGDWLIMPIPKIKEEKPFEFSFSDCFGLRKGFHISNGFLCRTGNDGSPKKLKNSIILDVNMAYLLGYYIADGSKGRKMVDLCFNAETETSYRDYLLKAIQTVFGDGVTISVYTREKCGHVIIQSTYVKDFFEKIIPGTSHNKRIPRAIITASPEIKRAFIKGLFNGDGSVGNNRAVYTTVSKDLAYDLKFLLLTLKIPSNIWEIKRKEAREKYGLGEHCFYNVAIPSIPITREILGIPETYKTRRVSNYHIEDDAIYMRVRKIEEFNYTGNVYDLSVDTSNEPSYCTNMCAVHNSGAGSITNYCLQITDLDPLRYNLLFERFLNPERISMPDIDTDFSFEHKDEIVKSEADANGYDHFSKIQTFTAMLPKSALKSCIRVAGLPPKVGDKLAKMIPDEAKHLSDALEMNPELKGEIDGNPELKKIWKIAVKVEGTKSAVSTHACGHIVSPVPCEDLYPCSVDKKTGYLVCQYNMVEAEHLGNLKKDLLMLRNLTVISFARSELKKQGIDVPLWTEKVLNDKETLAMIARGETMGVFQLESKGMQSFMKELRPDCFEDIIAGVSLYRPGPMDYIPKFVAGKRDPSKVVYDTPKMEPILKTTYGVMVYQEQVMQVARSLAGFSMGEADVLRKGVGKKKLDVIEGERKKFIYGDEEKGFPGCIKNGIPEKTATKIYDDIVKFASYAFNKSHAAAYAAISMETAYLKCHYPAIYMAGLMTSVSDNTDKLASYIQESRKAEISILPPDVNRSEVGFSVEDNKIRFGLGAIKKMGQQAAMNCIKERANGFYRSTIDLMKRNPDLNSGALESLAKAGGLDGFGLNRNTLVSGIKDVSKRLKKENGNAISGQMSFYDMFQTPLDQEYFEIMPEETKDERLRGEKEVIGVYLSGHPLEDYERFLNENTTIRASDLKKEEDSDGNLVSGDAVYDGMKAVYGGIITGKRVIYTKKTNEPMAFLTVEGLDGEVSCVVFPAEYKKNKELLEEDARILIRGSVSLSDEKDNSIIAEEIQRLDNLPKTLWLRFSTKQDYEKKEKDIEAMIQESPGKDHVMIYLSKDRMQKRIASCINGQDVLSTAKVLYGEHNVALTHE